jgi:hypothetical protein
MLPVFPATSSWVACTQADNVAGISGYIFLIPATLRRYSLSLPKKVIIRYYVNLYLQGGLLLFLSGALVLFLIFVLFSSY